MTGTQGLPGQLRGRQAQAPEPEQMTDLEVDAGKSDSEDGSGGLETDSDVFISKKMSFIISKSYCFISIYIQKLSFYISYGRINGY
jgi:hypothetical protein